MGLSADISDCIMSVQNNVKTENSEFWNVNANYLKKLFINLYTFKCKDI